MDKQDIEELSSINDRLKMFTANTLKKGEYRTDNKLTKLALISNSLCTLTYDMKVKVING